MPSGSYASGPGPCPLTCGPCGVGGPGLHDCSNGSFREHFPADAVVLRLASSNCKLRCRVSLWCTCPAMARIKEVGREPAEGEKDTIEECKKKEAGGVSTTSTGVLRT